MTAMDILFFLLLGWLAFKGFNAGLVTELLSLAAWVLAIFAVKLLHGPVTVALSGAVGTKAGAAVLAFSLIFGIAMFAGRLVARQIGNQSKNSFVGPFDRVLGGGFGALKGLIAASLAFLFVSLLYNTAYGRAAPRPKWMTASASYSLLNASSRALVDLVEERQGQQRPSPRAVRSAGD